MEKLYDCTPPRGRRREEEKQEIREDELEDVQDLSASERLAILAEELDEIQTEVSAMREEAEELEDADADFDDDD